MFKKEHFKEAKEVLVGLLYVTVGWISMSTVVYWGMQVDDNSPWYAFYPSIIFGSFVSYRIGKSFLYKWIKDK